MKTLFIDIETSPNIGFFWRSGYKLNIQPENIIKERAIICICYKWMGEREVHSLTWDNKQCDKSMLKKISKIILDADEIVGHNGDRFDIKWINGRLLKHGLDPLGQLTTTDTLKISRKMFNLNSHKLDYLGKYLKLGEKLDTGGFNTWKKVCLDKCENSLKKMVKYCKQDVKLLEKVYKKILTYGNSINKGRILHGKELSCHSCGSLDVISHGYAYRKNGLKKKRVQCKDCRFISLYPV